MNLTLLREMIAQDYVKVTKHPQHALYIYNYTPKAQYDRMWNECTLACRGLIMDASNKLVARPFQKFFNLGEMADQAIPNEPFEVYEKMDGSLGILYWAGDVPKIATRGSFMSDQAIKATQMLHSDYQHSIDKLDKNYTYLFEIIYPENRIVIDYGTKQELVLLAITETASGLELPLHDLGFPLVKHFHGLNDLHALKEKEEDNKEGFVVKFKSGYRLKVKFEEYQRIHRIVTGISNLDIWEYLKDGKDLLSILDRVPDEFYDWVKETKAKLLQEFSDIEAIAQNEFKIIGEERKETALYFQTCRYPAILFKMLDGKPYDDVIWKMIKPTFEKPFARAES